ncbi:MAG: sensor histidine kinase [Candidatus Promineifilaceae bacterium]
MAVMGSETDFKINFGTLYVNLISVSGVVLLIWSVITLADEENLSSLLILSLLTALATVTPTWFQVNNATMVYEVGSAVVMSAIPHFGIEGVIFAIAISAATFWIHTVWQKGLKGRIFLLPYNLGIQGLAVAAAAAFFHIYVTLAGNGFWFVLGWALTAILFDQLNVWLVIVGFYVRDPQNTDLLDLWRGNRWAMLLNILILILGGGILAFSLENYGMLGLGIFFLPILLSALAFQLYSGQIRANLAEMEILIAERTEALEVSNAELRNAIQQVSNADHEKELANEKLQAANQQLLDNAQAKDRFLAVLSHDMRSPITSISLYGQMMEKRPELPAEKRQHMSRVIQQNAQVLVELVDDVVEVERLSGKTLEPNLTRFDLSELGMQIISSFEAQAGKKQISLRLDVFETPHMIKADVQLIRRVINNLVSNAVKYTQKGGAVSLSLERLMDGTQITVADTGLGIPEAELSHIFNSYHRVKEHQHQAKGLGLGLSIVKHYVEAHQGMVLVESQAGEGSRFKVWLPQVAELPEPVAFADLLQTG